MLSENRREERGGRGDEEDEEAEVVADKNIP